MSMLTAVTASAQKSATFEKIWLEHNVMYKGQKCLAIHVAVTANGMKDRKLTCTAYVDSPKGTAHKDTNGSYKSKDGQVAVSSTGKCPYYSTHWDSFVIYLPNDEIHPKSGKNDYYVHVEAWDGSIHLGTSDYTSFSMTGSGSGGNGNVANGDYKEVTCSTCQGTGIQKCYLCAGSGLIMTGYSNYLCTACSGHGWKKCLPCSGKGTIRVSTKPATPVYSGGGYSGGSSGIYSGGSSSSYSGGSSSSSSRTCPGCGGTGKGPDQIKYGPNYTGETKYEYCSKCGRNMDSHHYHVQGTCTVCHGRGTVN